MQHVASLDGFDTALAERAGAGGHPWFVLLLDVAGLGWRNMRDGPQAGDEALMALSAALVLLPGPGLVSPRVGDEWLVAFPAPANGAGEAGATVLEQLSARSGVALHGALFPVVTAAAAQKAWSSGLQMPPEPIAVYPCQPPSVPRV